MLRRIHALPGLLAALLIALLAVTGAFLALESVAERAGTTVAPPGRIDVATLAEAAQAQLPGLDRLVRTASGSIIAYSYDRDRAAAHRLDALTGAAIAPYELSSLVRTVTNLHRSLMLGDTGRAASGLGALAMMVLCVSGLLMLVARQGGWASLLRPVRGDIGQRLHGELGRAAVLLLLLSALTGCWMSLTTFGLLPDGATVEAAPRIVAHGGARLPVGELAALRAVDLAQLRELTFPDAADLTDTYGLTTAEGLGHVDAATGTMLDFVPGGRLARVQETIRILHTAQGIWPLALALGLSALAAPVLAVAGGLIWWQRRRALPRIPNNAGPNAADIILLVGSEGHATWGFAGTLHAALTKAGHRVHAAPMNNLAKGYARAARLILLTATYGDGCAPASARRFLARLADTPMAPLPVAVLGFGDRRFSAFCGFAEEVAAALRGQGWPMILAPSRIDRQSAQAFAEWGTAFGTAIATPLTLTHGAVPPKTVTLSLASRTDHGAEAQAPTVILRFVQPPGPRAPGFWSRFRAPRLPRFAAGDLVGILAPGTTLPRFYSLATSSADGALEICVRKRPGGLCSGFLHDLKPGATIEAFIRPNPTFRPLGDRAPLILVGAGTGIAPLMGFIRHNRRRRPVRLYWGGRLPESDFLYEAELTRCIADRRLARLRTAFSRSAGGLYVQDRLADDGAELRELIRRGAQVMVCGGRDMAGGVARAFETIVRPLGLDLTVLKSEGRYLEDVY